MKKLVLLFAIIPLLSFGWGGEGHRITGAVAEMYLNHIARSKINNIMGKESVEDVSNWLDWMRDDWGSARSFHYISMPIDETAYKPSHCVKGVCAMSMIDKYVGRLQNQYESPEAKTEALKIIVHLFEDLHMPLHTGGKEGDYGGNKVKVDFFGKESNIHKVFDYEIIQKSGMSQEQWVVNITKGLTEEKVRQIQEGTLVDWVNESHKLVPSIYENLPKKRDGEVLMNDEYVAFATPIIEQQMLYAGIRLAKFLNDTMGKVVVD